ncbi:hypothetical protein V1520DRAFT_330875 [Lipomyces starkeyi]|uniref:Exosome complex protein n=1 Tax=Lipomyces starkeyi NRRL Y-11557 TaxID=675824 RepID=A0A1E3PWI0_LIPST|nr:hypothetical protein LIPSTDRAFT_6452 [Lipomyces starkeyi NRRL Y-11557]
MSAADELYPLIENLEKEMGELESSLKPIIDNGVADYANDMAPIDKAKAYLLSLYALNSTIYSTLKIGEINTADHHIMIDIRRVQTYMAKIKNAEELFAGRQLQLDRQAAGRFIKHALSGNEAYDENRARKKAKSLEQGQSQNLIPKTTGSPESDGEHEEAPAVEEQVTKFLKAYKNADASEDSTESSSEKKYKNKRKNKSRKQNGTEEN